MSSPETEQQKSEREDRGPAKAWPWMAGALAAAGLGAGLLALGGPHEPAATGQSAPPSTVAATPASAADSTTGAIDSAAPREESREKALESSPARQSTESGKPQVRPTETSAARSRQIQVEQRAAQSVAAEVDPQAAGQAEDLADRFVQAWLGRSWQSTRQEWAARLTELAAPEVVEQLDQDADWEGQSWQWYVEAESVTHVQVLETAVQSERDGAVEVAVAVATRTESEDPWAATARSERRLTVVVDPARGKVVDQFEMTPRGGL